MTSSSDHHSSKPDSRDSNSPLPTRQGAVKPSKSGSGWKILLLLLFLGCGTYFVVRSINATAAEESLSPVVAAGESPANLAAAGSTGITAGLTNEVIAAAPRPLVPLLELADRALAKIDANISDYTATLSNQVRIKGRLREPNKMFVKIRHRQATESDQSPFSIYMRFIEPQANRGREVIWVDGWNEGNLVVHLTGWQNLVRIYLDPNGSMAMDGNLYPISMIGMRNLLVQVREKGERDRDREDCEVRLERGLSLNDREVTCIEIIHPRSLPELDYHIAKIYLDEEWGIPVGFEGYLWPEQEGGEPVLLERYFYTDVQVNVGLQDLDFDPANPDYDFPDG